MDSINGNRFLTALDQWLTTEPEEPMRYTVTIFDPLNDDADEDRDQDTTYTLGQARAFATTVTSLNPNCIAMIYQRGSYDWADERVGGDYDAACLRRREEEA